MASIYVIVHFDTNRLIGHHAYETKEAAEQARRELIPQYAWKTYPIRMLPIDSRRFEPVELRTD